MKDTIKKIDYKGYEIEIYYSESDSPEDWEDKDGIKLISFHKRYGNNHGYGYDQEDFDRAIADHKKTHLAYPVFVYDHSGLSFSISNKSYPFNDRWDAGVYGLLMLPKREWKKKGKKADKFAKNWIEEYSSWSNGEVYGFKVTNKDGEDIDSVGGYIGDMDFAIQEAKDVIDHEIKSKLEKHISKRKAQIKAHAPISKREAYKNPYFITRDGKRVRKLKKGEDAMHTIHRMQGQSMDYAMKHGGYGVEYQHGKKKMRMSPSGAWSRVKNPSWDFKYKDLNDNQTLVMISRSSAKNMDSAWEQATELFRQDYVKKKKRVVTDQEDLKPTKGYYQFIIYHEPDKIKNPSHKITLPMLESMIAENNRLYGTDFKIGGAYNNYELWAGSSRLEAGSKKDIYNAFVKYRFNEKYIAKKNPCGKRRRNPESDFIYFSVYVHPDEYSEIKKDFKKTGLKETTDFFYSQHAVFIKENLINSKIEKIMEYDTDYRYIRPQKKIKNPYDRFGESVDPKKVSLENYLWSRIGHGDNDDVDYYYEYGNEKAIDIFEVEKDEVLQEHPEVNEGTKWLTFATDEQGFHYINQFATRSLLNKYIKDVQGDVPEEN